MTLLNDTLKSMLSREKIIKTSGMLKVGDPFPDFKVKGVVGNKKEDIIEIGKNTYPKKWLVIFSWPKDFTFVCPTEISEFNKLDSEFKDRDAQLLGLSVDNEYVHLAWRQSHADLRDLKFPMLSDIKREISSNCGILDEKTGVAQRATFIVDPEGIIRFIMVTDSKVGRNTREVLRVLDALQTDEQCPCNWEKGQEYV